jgi:VanZ family protein
MEQCTLNEPLPMRRYLIVGVWLMWMVAIFYFSTQSWGSTETKSWVKALLITIGFPASQPLATVGLDELNFVIRKLAHFTEYAVLTALGYWAWVKGISQPALTAIRYTLLISILFAISDEFHQRFEIGRTSLLTDVFIDSLGASVMAVLLYWWFVARASTSGNEPLV